MNKEDIVSALREKELSQLFGPVPLLNQQRDTLVRVGLRPGFHGSYTGPVNLGDLRLVLSPWQWAAAELGSTPRTEGLNKALTLARVTAAVPGLDTVAGVAAWLSQELKESGASWYSFPGNHADWGNWGPLGEMIEVGNDSFLPPNLELLTVLFYINFSPAANLRLAVAQARWESSNPTETGRVGIYSCSDQVGAEDSQYPAWLMASDSLLLTDPVTGEQAELMPGGPDDEEAGAGPAEWAGMQPKSEPGPLYKVDRGPGPAWVRGGLLYEDGQLKRSDTGQVLQLQLFLAASLSNSEVATGAH